jgi:molybdate transport system substrate-binding protein
MIRAWARGVALGGATVACGAAPGSNGAGGELVVFAASSLGDAFTVIGEDFERAHAGVDVSFDFAGTQQLRTRLEHGAAADVFASADPQDMVELVAAGRVDAPRRFAENEPVVVVAPEAASVVRSLADLAHAERVVIGSEEAPIGRYALQILDRAGAAMGDDFRARVEARVVSREPDVRQVLARVRMGEAQAGIVYRTDAKIAGDEVVVVPIPPEVVVVAEYPIAVVTGTREPELARAFVEHLLAADGRRRLEEAGFRAPSAGDGR